MAGRPTSGTNGVQVELKAFSGKVLSPFSPHLESGITMMTHVLPVVTASLRSFKARSLKKKLLESRKTQMCAVPSVLSASCHKSVVFR